MINLGMKIKVEDIIPHRLREKGCDLNNIGVNELAWHYADILEIISIIENENYIILGGDVLKGTGLNAEYTYDNWHYDINEVLSKKENELLSIAKARKYIEDYSKNNGVHYYYTLTIKR